MSEIHEIYFTFSKSIPKFYVTSKLCSTVPTRSFFCSDHIGQFKHSKNFTHVTFLSFQTIKYSYVPYYRTYIVQQNRKLNKLRYKMLVLVGQTDNNHLWSYDLYCPVCNKFEGGKSITRAIGRVGP